MFKKFKDNTTQPVAAPIFSQETQEEPTDADKNNLQEKAKTGRGWSTRKKWVFGILCTLVLIIVCVGIYVYAIWSDPMGQFVSVANQITPSPSASQSAEGTNGSKSEPAPDPLEILKSQADTSFLKDTINILLIGVDHSVERDTDEWAKHGGKQAFHSDVMLILAINKSTGAINMISLPRDTYAKIPGVDGIYKLNASIDCGGGWHTDAGFKKVCEAASWMLGGIPVEYYYAVDMNAVKGLADGIGGVQNFDVEMEFTMDGRAYKAGVQDMNGQAVLDYLRVRKHIDDAGDLNRVNRQKKMLIAIFNKIKQNGLLTSIPGMLEAFQGNLYTNVPLSYTAGLALFAYNVSPDSIGMYSMGGKYHYGIFNWNFVITDQKARVDLIKKIYNADVPQYKDYAAAAATRLWEKMRAPVIKNQGEKALKKVKTLLDADAKLKIYVEPTPTPSPSPSPSPSTSPTPSPSPSPSTSSSPSPSTSTEPSPSTEITGLSIKSIGSKVKLTLVSVIPAGYRQYLPDGTVWKLYNKAVSTCTSLGSQNSTDAMKSANDQTIADIESLCKTFSISLPEKYWRVNYEKNDNEIYVNFN
jgi:LCP family protein required for cell wall assembly